MSAIRASCTGIRAIYVLAPPFWKPKYAYDVRSKMQVQEKIAPVTAKIEKTYSMRDSRFFKDES